MGKNKFGITAALIGILLVVGGFISFLVVVVGFAVVCSSVELLDDVLVAIYLDAFVLKAIKGINSTNPATISSVAKYFLSLFIIPLRNNIDATKAHRPISDTIPAKTFQKLFTLVNCVAAHIPNNTAQMIDITPNAPNL